MRTLTQLAGKEFRDGLRNRWVAASIAALAGLALVLALLGSAPVGDVGASALSVTVVSLTSLTVYLLPLIALMLSYDAIVGEQERGTLQLLLSYPVARWQVVLGKFLGHLLILVLAIILGFGSAALVITGLGGADREGWLAFLSLCGSAALLGAVFVALGYLLSVLCDERAKAAGLAIGLWSGPPPAGRAAGDGRGSLRRRDAGQSHRRLPGLQHEPLRKRATGGRVRRAGGGGPAEPLPASPDPRRLVAGAARGHDRRLRQKGDLSMRIAALASALLAFLLLAGCGEEKEAARPDPQEITREAIGYYCNMIVADHEGPKAQLYLKGESEPIWFSSVRDAVAFTLLPDEPKTIAAVYVNDMAKASWNSPEAGTWIEIGNAHFVIGSARRGGMGALEAVPFGDPEQAAAFAEAHGGQVVALSDIPEDYILSAAVEGGGDQHDMSGDMQMQEAEASDDHSGQ
jgi:Cu-processing system permease protein